LPNFLHLHLFAEISAAHSIKVHAHSIKVQLALYVNLKKTSVHKSLVWEKFVLFPHTFDGFLKIFV